MKSSTTITSIACTHRGCVPTTDPATSASIAVAAADRHPRRRREHHHRQHHPGERDRARHDRRDEPIDDVGPRVATNPEDRAAPRDLPAPPRSPGSPNSRSIAQNTAVSSSRPYVSRTTASIRPACHTGLRPRSPRETLRAAMAEQEWPYEVEPFRCHRCGNCCRGDGFVNMTEDDLARAADLLGRTRDEFVTEYCSTQPDGQILLIDQADPLRSCIFLKQRQPVPDPRRQARAVPGLPDEVAPARRARPVRRPARRRRPPAADAADDQRPQRLTRGLSSSRT
jgi:hypothetical protein